MVTVMVTPTWLISISHGSQVLAKEDIKQVTLLIYAHTYGIMHTLHSKEDIYKDVMNLEADSILKSSLEFMEYYLK